MFQKSITNHMYGLGLLRHQMKCAPQSWKQRQTGNTKKHLNFGGRISFNESMLASERIMV